MKTPEQWLQEYDARISRPGRIDAIPFIKAIQQDAFDHGLKYSRPYDNYDPEQKPFTHPLTLT